MEALAQLQAGLQQAAVAAGLDATLVAYTLAALVAGLLATCLLRLYQARYSYYSAPSPRIRPPYWALGNVEIVERVADRHKLYQQWHEELGPFVRMRIAHRSMLLVADPAAASSVLTKGPSYLPKKPSEYTAFDVAHGLHGYNGMLTHQDEGTWAAARRAITPAFTLSQVKRQYPTLLRCMADTFATLDASLAAGTADFDVEHHMLMATNQLIARGFLQLPEGFIDAHQQAEDVSFIMAVASRFICEPWRWFAHLYMPFLTAETRRMWFARRRLAGWAESIYDLLQERYEAGVPEDDNSLAACLMRITDKHGGKPKRRALVAEICDALTASETVPSSITWTLYCVAVRPQLQQQLQEELAAAGITSTTVSGSSRRPSSTPSGSDGGNDAPGHVRDQDSKAAAASTAATSKHQANGSTAAAAAAFDAASLAQRRERLLELFAQGGPDVLKQLPLLSACLNEAMRLYPAGAPGAPREVEKPTQVGPYLVPPGVIVFPNLFAIMNVSANWEQPDQFKPERWQACEHPEKDPVSGAARWVPFSLGPKACAGQNLAMLQSKADLALLLAGYEWSLAPRMGGEAGVAARTYLGVTIKVHDGLWLTAKPRL